MILWLFGFVVGNWAMLVPVLGFLAFSIFVKDLKLIVVGVLAVFAAVYVGNLKGELAVAEGARVKAEASAAESLASVEKQNLAVEGWKAAAIQNALAVRNSEARAAKLAAAIPPKTEAILQLHIPSKFGEATCEESMQWLLSPERLQSYTW